MYQFVDRDLDHLDGGCRFLVWSMRAWVTSIGQRACPAHVLAPAFARWRMIGGLQPFHRTMLLLNRDALETFGFRPLACRSVSEHEALILGVLVSLREQGPAQARATLELMVAEDGVGDLLGCLSDLGGALASAGLFPADPVPAANSGTMPPSGC